MEKYSTHLGMEDITKEIKCNSPQYYFENLKEKFTHSCGEIVEQEESLTLFMTVPIGSIIVLHYLVMLGIARPGNFTPRYRLLEKFLYVCIQKYI